MADDLTTFITKKKSDSEYIALEDGEKVKIIKLLEIKAVTKAGFNGDEKDVLRLVCQVDTPYGVKSKKFDNGTNRFALHLRDLKIRVGNGFTITRIGLGAKTRYEVSDIVEPSSESII